MATATLIPGKVKYAAGQPRQTQYGGPDQCGDCEAGWWGRHQVMGQAGRRNRAFTKRGNRLGNARWQNLQTACHQPKPGAKREWQDDNLYETECAGALGRRSSCGVFDELKHRAGILTSCHEEVRKRFLHPRTGELTISEETLQKYGTTLFLDLKELW